MKHVKLDTNPKILMPTEITYYLNPDYIYIPILKNTLKVKDSAEVLLGEQVGEYQEKLAISSVSGEFLGIRKIKFANSFIDALVIQNDFRELQTKIKKSKKKITQENIITALEEHHEYELLNKFQKYATIENIIISAIDDNPYVYTKIFLLQEKINDILELLNTLSIIYKTKNNLLVVKNNDSKVIDKCLNTIGTYPNIKLTLTSDEYLLGTKHFLLHVLNIEDNYLYLDSIELIKLANILNGDISTTKLITISGDATKENIMLRVKINTELADIINKYVTINTHKYFIVANGLMTGFIVDDPESFIITDDIFSINIMAKKRVVKTECINCGKCLSICPVGVNPITKKNANKCIDCGLCTYICPANINLREGLGDNHE